jgi:hypothetical protein
MGMYTEIIFGAALRKDTPKHIIEIIQKMVNREGLYGLKPDHPFFESKCSWLLAANGSYYFPGIVEPQFKFNDIAEQWYLHLRTNIKNYNNEIEKFLDWIKPYIYKGSGTRDFYAIVTYEADETPTIYYLGESIA